MLVTVPTILTRVVLVELYINFQVMIWEFIFGGLLEQGHPLDHAEYILAKVHALHGYTK